MSFALEGLKQLVGGKGTETYAIMGASGHVGQATLRALNGILFASKPEVPFKVIGLVHTQSKKKMITDLGATAVFMGDEHENLKATLENVDALFLCPPSKLDRTKIAKKVIDIAKDAGVGRIVAISVADADKGKTLFQRQFSEIETALEDSGIDYTILRSPFFFDNILKWGGKIFDKRTVVSNLDGTQGVHYVSCENVGEAVAGALTNKAHANRTYDLWGDYRTCQEVASFLSTALGVPIKHKQVTDEEFAKELVECGVEGWMANGIVEMYSYEAQREKGEDTNAMRQLTGHAALRFHRWVQNHARALIAGSEAALKEKAGEQQKGLFKAEAMKEKRRQRIEEKHAEMQAAQRLVEETQEALAPYAAQAAASPRRAQTPIAMPSFVAEAAPPPVYLTSPAPERMMAYVPPTPPPVFVAPAPMPVRYEVPFYEHAHTLKPVMEGHETFLPEHPGRRHRHRYPGVPRHHRSKIVEREVLPPLPFYIASPTYSNAVSTSLPLSTTGTVPLSFYGDTTAYGTWTGGAPSMMTSRIVERPTAVAASPFASPLLAPRASPLLAPRLVESASFVSAPPLLPASPRLNVLATPPPAVLPGIPFAGRRTVMREFVVPQAQVETIFVENPSYKQQFGAGSGWWHM